MAKKVSALGRTPFSLGGGLDSLINTEPEPQGGSSINEIDIEVIKANPNQPRTNFDEEALDELAESIRNLGVISPITLREVSANEYQIIAGERRWRAAKKAGLTKIPAYIKTANDEQEVHLMALIENIQREDLNAIEVALSYQRLQNEYKLTQEAISQQVGKKRSTVANYLRLLNLPSDIQLGLKDNKIEMGHARVLAGIENTMDQLKAYEKIVREGLSVRATENLVKNTQRPTTASEPKIIKNQALSNTLTEQLSMKSEVASAHDGSGRLTIKFKNEAQLNRLVELLSNKS